MLTPNVVLTEHQQNFVETLVQSGRYQNASAVLREGLRLIERREQLDTAKLKVLRDAENKDWEDLNAGRYTDVADAGLEAFIAQLGLQAAQRSR